MAPPADASGPPEGAGQTATAALPGPAGVGGVGLGPEEVAERVRAGLVNAAQVGPGRTWRQILRANVLTRFNAILGSLLVVVAVVGPPQDGLFGVVLVANAAIGIIQEARAKRTLDRLAILTAPRAKVVRDGTTTEMVVEEIVLDDVLELHRGDQVPVDAEVVVSQGLEIDESLLSGESLPVPKVPGNTVLSGSFVVSGTATVRTTAVGAASYATTLEARARRFSLVRSELQSGTNRILRAVTWVMVPAGAALVATQLLRSHQSMADALRGSVAGVAAMVPEGLVLLTSVAFAAGALRLARQRVLVQELAAIEGLARVDVVCIDKTGTLTEPGIHLETIEPLAEIPPDEVASIVEDVAASDPAPNATMRSLARTSGAASGRAVVGRVSFSSARRWSAVTFADDATWILGAPEMVAPDLDAPAEALAARHRAAGHRVLLLARSPAPINEGAPPALPDPSTPVALVVLAEHVRQDAAATVAYLRAQGVAITVLSGDAPETVAAIAARVGIVSDGPPCDASSLPGAPGPGPGDHRAGGDPAGGKGGAGGQGGAGGDGGAGGEASQALAAALARSAVFGRVQPGQKVAAVRALQEAGHVVAMVGDGVNDVPALKEADLGIAMGSGSPSSRSVARVVLLDDSFATVPAILGEGRRVIANIERVANLFVTKTVMATVLAVVVAVTAMPFPFFARHLTIVSTLTIGVPGFFLALASGAPRASPGFTRRVVGFTLPAGLAAALATLSSYAVARAVPPTTSTQARTTAMLALFGMALWVLVLVARPLDPPRLALVAAMSGGLVLVFALPLGRQEFSLAVPPTTVLVAMVALVACSVGLLTVWRTAWAGRQWLRRRR